MIEKLEDVSFFYQEPFIKDQIRYNLIYRLLEYENPLVLSNWRDAAIVQSDASSPVWVWTAEGISDKNLAELCHAMVRLFQDREHLVYTAKPEVIAPLAKAFKLDSGRVSKKKLHLMAYDCMEVNEGLFYEGQHFSFIENIDLPVISTFIGKNMAEREEPVSSETDRMIFARALQKDPDFYIWKNDLGEITTMARIGHRTKEHARINFVFTDGPFRNRGYSAMLIASLCGIILREGRIPMLYTDYDYPPSNRSYQKVGFKPRGALMEYQLF